VAEKASLKQLKRKWDVNLNELQAQIDAFQEQIDALKEQRKNLSNALQQRLFSHYRFLNQYGTEKSLGEIFRLTANPVPPAGSGECAAPKLLHYAFQHQMTPISLAEFWWGASPKSEIRQHKKFYPACQNKCQPILAHMLDGLKLDDNPLLHNPAQGKEIDIIYQDEAIVVVNKPAEFLSVPGVNIQDSVYTRLQQMFSSDEGLFVIHRLDMSTSGLLVFALTRRANKSLQKQFITRGVEKRYLALLAGELQQSHGDIRLPLRGDLDDRPRQLVCFEHGKPADTHWQLIECRDGFSKVYLYPKTGRTHQLRVHCAHVEGLNLPIVGDDLYGSKGARLHLHAESLSFDHPYTKQRMTFTVDAEF
jgi:tRNA pseudouridine32 synthase / 23S rRNA pseudouridine746 synthase